MTEPITAAQIRLNVVDLLQTANDPSVTPTPAAIGSLLLRSGTGQAWLKTSAPDTGWQKFVQSMAWYGRQGVRRSRRRDHRRHHGGPERRHGVCRGGRRRRVLPTGDLRGVTQLTITGLANAAAMGSGMDSSIKWLWERRDGRGLHDHGVGGLEPHPVLAAQVRRLGPDESRWLLATSTT